jgi:small-conductance mechanosensitive channel
MVYEITLERNWLWPLIFIFSGLISGIIFQKFLLPRLKRMVSQTKWERDDIALDAISKYIILWFALFGFYAAAFTAPISISTFKVIETVLFIVAAFSVTLVLAKIATDFVTFYARKREGVFQATSMFMLIINAVTLIAGILIILKALRIDLTPIIAALGIGSIAVALAIQEPLGNFFSGLHIIASSQIRPGDYLKLDTGDEGQVKDISWRSTTMQTPSNNVILVPNKTLASAIVTNYHLMEMQMSVSVDVGVSYKSDLEEVEHITLEVARSVMKEAVGGVPDFNPILRYKKFGDFSIDFTVIMRAADYNQQYRIRHEFIKRLFKRYRQEGIEIPYPIRRIYLNDD